MLLRVTENSGVTEISIPKNTKFTVMPLYKTGRGYSNHKTKEEAQTRVKRLTTEKTEFVIFNSKRQVVNLKDFLYD